ncbi:FKBP-type peptidyl-prolyl isomerase [Penicillium hetheringtonii]|uniref:peptidylprolyl isomerase n=1 Tax=Penicillium hetheringtonii TaxID=911720 RepID=A0AAD6DH60_9EURO|nr:FKBP-type peptidyl-prolyl isomerase [Penicillium hetheringtonii]
MGVDKKVLTPGNGVDFPKKGDNIAMHYTGCLYDASKADNHFMGFKFDSSHNPGRGSPLASPIGVGRLIKGWDEGVPQMSLGKKAILTISPDYGYGANGFPGLIPPNSTLVFEVELMKINNKSV